MGFFLVYAFSTKRSCKLKYCLTSDIFKTYEPDRGHSKSVYPTPAGSPLGYHREVGRMKTGIIYAYTHKATGRMYIGKTISPRERHLSHVSGKNAKYQHIDRAMLKYGENAFFYEILIKNIPQTELNAWEEYFIWMYKSNESGFNKTPGGDADSIHFKRIWERDGYKEKMSDAYIKRSLGQWKENHLKAMKKLHGSEKWKEVVKLSHKKAVESGGWEKTRKAAEEYAKSEKHISLLKSKKRRAMMSKYGKEQNWADKLHTKEIRDKIRAKALLPERRLLSAKIAKERLSQPITCVELGKTFFGYGEASLFCKISKTSICRAATGKQAHAGGYTWVKALKK